MWFSSLRVYKKKPAMLQCHGMTEIHVSLIKLSKTKVNIDTGIHLISFGSLCHGDAIWQHTSRLTFYWVMTCCMIAPSHYPNQCSHFIKVILWHSSENIFPSAHELQLKNVFRYWFLTSLLCLSGTNDISYHVVSNSRWTCAACCPVPTWASHDGSLWCIWL